MWLMHFVLLVLLAGCQTQNYATNMSSTNKKLCEDAGLKINSSECANYVNVVSQREQQEHLLKLQQQGVPVQYEECVQSLPINTIYKQLSTKFGVAEQKIRDSIPESVFEDYAKCTCSEMLYGSSLPDEAIQKCQTTVSNSFVSRVYGTQQEKNSSKLTLNDLMYNFHPIDTGKAIKVKTDESGTYANIDSKKQYIQLENNIKKQASDFSSLVLKGIETGAIKKLSREENNKALDAWVVYSYTNLENQTPIYYCNKYYPISKYKDLFIKNFQKAHLESKKRLINAWGEPGFEYVSEGYKGISVPDIGTMEDNYKDFKQEMALQGVDNADRVAFCKFINYAPQLLLEQQIELFKIQHPDYIQFLSR